MISHFIHNSNNNRKTRENKPLLGGTDLTAKLREFFGPFVNLRPPGNKTVTLAATHPTDIVCRLSVCLKHIHVWIFNDNFSFRLVSF